MPRTCASYSRPYNAIGQVTLEIKGLPTKVGTGFLIAPKFILTAAHLFTVPPGAQILSGKFTLWKGGEFTLKRNAVHPDYDQDRSTIHDIAVAELSGANKDDNVLPFSIRALRQDGRDLLEEVDRHRIVAGFVSDQNYNGDVMYSEVLIRPWPRVLPSGGPIIYDHGNTTNTQSGGPVWDPRTGAVEAVISGATQVPNITGDVDVAAPILIETAEFIRKFMG